MLSIHYLCATLEIPYTESLYSEILCKPTQDARRQTTYPLGKHSNPTRFRGSKVQLYSPTVSPDYPFVARVEGTENNGESVWLSWTDFVGKRTGPYMMRPEDKIIIIGLKDSERAERKPEVAPVRRPATQHKTELRTDGSYLKTLCKLLKREGIGFKPDLRVIDDSVTVELVFGKYYVEFANGLFELGSQARGVLNTFRPTIEGIGTLIKRIEKIETNFNVVSIVKNGRGRRYRD